MLEPRRVLVPVHGDPADEQAVRLACSLVKKGKGRVFVLYVVEVERSLPLDSSSPTEAQRCDAVLGGIEAIAKEEKCPVELEVLQAREAGPAVVEEAIQRDADLIVMGLSLKRHKGEYTLGTTLPYVLRKAPCRVWVSREPAANGDPQPEAASGLHGNRLAHP